LKQAHAACVAAIMADDPNELRCRAERYRQIAKRMLDGEAIRALHELACDFRKQADEIEAAMRHER
jgi:hypothetical protein